VPEHPAFANVCAATVAYVSALRSAANAAAFESGGFVEYWYVDVIDGTAPIAAAPTFRPLMSKTNSSTKLRH